MDQLQPNPQNNITSPAYRKWLYIGIGIILLLVLGVGVWWYISLKTPPQETKKEIALQDQTADWKTYRNETAGIQFKYPAEWQLDETFVDPITHGDITKDGKPFTSFVINLNGNNTGILISHTYPDDDNKSVTEQLGTLRCSEYYYIECKELVSDKNVPYIRTIEPHLAELPGGSLHALVPTGKYILSFQLPADVDVVKDPNHPAIKVFDAILKSLEFPGETANWKSYRNEEYGFEFTYPQEYQIKDASLSKDDVFLRFYDGEVVPKNLRFILSKNAYWKNERLNPDEVFYSIYLDAKHQVAEKPLLYTYAVPDFKNPKYFVRILASADGTNFIALQTSDINAESFDYALAESDKILLNLKFIQ
ncbi:MAG: hypothetical protein A2925_04900 [Candidatus Yanofskybacteria bacterium RIFCSPLOWO2_01_FULL_44_22]|uniref:Uncharacterized protein n=1 Tax=Candidatus Yanofskybacteria bacterium RIFCSPLOWO2_01_FULL_44_22 TaxID=1802697 RepID=A0A1F8GLK6_9BACT|nr:MAG: hypothetical protein A2925_04900 [Candidatus Yanofskybacteria bacterium RIFCSPLOWO2_01_FULL_44_22]